MGTFTTNEGISVLAIRDCMGNVKAQHVELDLDVTVLFSVIDQACAMVQLFINHCLDSWALPSQQREGYSDDSSILCCLLSWCFRLSNQSARQPAGAETSVSVSGLWKSPVYTDHLYCHMPLLFFLEKEEKYIAHVSGKIPFLMPVRIGVPIILLPYKCSRFP